MKEENRYNTDELEQLLSRRCEFHASDSLREKIVSAAEDMDAPKRNGFTRYIPWIASAACVAAVVGTILFAYNPEVTDETDRILAISLDMPDSSSASIPQEKPDYAGLLTTTEPPKKTSSRQSHLTAPRRPIPSNPQPPTDHLPTTNDTPQPATDFEIPDFPEEEYVVYAMTSEEAVLIPMTLVPEEIIRRQEESTREYIDYMRQEIESAQKRRLQKEPCAMPQMTSEEIVNN